MNKLWAGPFITFELESKNKITSFSFNILNKYNYVCSYNQNKVPVSYTLYFGPIISDSPKFVDDTFFSLTHKVISYRNLPTKDKTQLLSSLTEINNLLFFGTDLKLTKEDVRALDSMRKNS